MHTIGGAVHRIEPSGTVVHRSSSFNNRSRSLSEACFHGQKLTLQDLLTTQHKKLLVNVAVGPWNFAPRECALEPPVMAAESRTRLQPKTTVRGCRDHAMSPPRVQLLRARSRRKSSDATKGKCLTLGAPPGRTSGPSRVLRSAPRCLPCPTRDPAILRLSPALSASSCELSSSSHLCPCRTVRQLRQPIRAATALCGTVVVTEKATDALAPPDGAAAMLASIPSINSLPSPDGCVTMIGTRNWASAPRGCRSPTGIRRSRHFCLTERTNCSACALQFEARNGVLMTRTPDVSSRCRTAGLHFRSQSQIKKRPSWSRPSLASVSWHKIWSMNASCGCGADDADAPRVQFNHEHGLVREPARGASRPPA